MSLNKFEEQSILSPGTIKSYLQSLKLLISFCEKNILDITRDDIIRYRNSRKNLKRTTQNRDLRTFSTFFKWAVNEGLITINPVENIKAYSLKKSERIKIHYISHKDALRLIEQPLRPSIIKASNRQFRDHCILSILYYAGLRPSELVNLKWTDVNFKEKTLFIEESKGYVSRIVEIPSILIVRLELLRSRFRKESYVITTNKRQMSKNAIRDVVKKYARRISLVAIGDRKTVTPVTLRHSYATRLTELGVASYVLGEQMGNSSVVDRYAHSTTAGKRRAADLMEED